METMEFPIFYGEEPEEWVTWMDAFIADQSLSEFETRQFRYGFIDGEAHTWYCEELSRFGFDSWEDLKVRLVRRFSTRAVEAKEQPKIVSCVGGKRSSNDLIPEPIPSLTKPEEKNEACVFMSEPVTQVATSEEALKEDQLVPLGNPVLGKQSEEEQSGNMRKKKKRWKKLCYEEEDLYGFGVESRDKTQGQEYKNQKRVNKDNNAHQMLDKMPLTRKEATKKNKRRKVKGINYHRPKHNIKATFSVAQLGVYGKLVSLVTTIEMKILMEAKEHKIRYKYDMLTKLPWEYKIVLEKLAKWRKCKFKQKLNKQKRDSLMQNWMGYAAKTSERDKSKYKHMAYRKFFSFVTSLWMKRMIKVKSQRVTKVKGFKYKHRAVNSMKCHGENMPNENNNERFSGKKITLIWDSKLALELVRRYINGRRKSSKRNHVKKVFLGSDKLLQLDDIVKSVWKLLLAVVQRKKAKLKYIYMGCGEIFLLGKTVRPLKDHGKQNKGSVKHDKTRRWKYKLGKMELSLQVFRVERDGTECERKSGDEGEKCNHNTVELTCLSSNKTTQWEETFTEADREQELKGITHILQKRAHGSVFKTQTTIEELCGWLSSVFLIKKNTSWLVKSLMEKHSFELGNRVWEPGIVAGRQGCSGTGKRHYRSGVGVANNGKNNFSEYCITYLDEWKKEYEAFYGISCENLLKSDEEAPKLLVELCRWQHHLYKHGCEDIFKGDMIIKLIEFIVHVLLHVTYEMFHLPRPPELLGLPILDLNSEKFGSLVDWDEYQTYNNSSNPELFYSRFKIGVKFTTEVLCFRFTTYLKLCRQNREGVEQEDNKEKGTQFLPSNIEDKKPASQDDSEPPTRPPPNPNIPREYDNTPKSEPDRAGN
ncbi:hypothetical protein N665_0048s0016 [Sinapis alba]|nr:hypothetical protein N665_0048s0016 [Sinapis alba]